MKMILGIIVLAVLVILMLPPVTPESLRTQADNLQRSQDDLAAAKKRLNKALDESCRISGICK